MSIQTFHHAAPDGSTPYGDVTKINGPFPFAGPGSFEINATGIWVLSAATDNIAFDPGGNFDGVIMSRGGNVSPNGDWNLVTGSGAIAVDEAGAGDRHNAFDVTTSVTALAVNDTASRWSTTAPALQLETGRVPARSASCQPTTNHRQPACRPPASPSRGGVASGAPTGPRGHAVGRQSEAAPPLSFQSSGRAAPAWARPTSHPSRTPTPPGRGRS